MGAERFRQLDNFLRRAAGVHLIARHNHDPARRDLAERLRQLVQRARHGVVVYSRRRLYSGVAQLFHHVHRQGEQHRTSRRVAGSVKRAAYQHRELVGAGDLLRPLHDRRADGHNIVIQQRVADVVPRILLSNGHHQRGFHDPRINEIPHAVPQAARGMQIDKAGLAGGFRVAVGNRHHGALLKRQNIVNIFMAKQGINQRKLGGAGVAKNIFHAFTLQHFKKNIGTRSHIEI